ncbi:oligosaccharide repeat unit polymerase [Curtobacterium sp. ODYSSEY 48 V2]|uniref:O-antigen polymerase n=1 Tax=Curtobacterium sp. ODYSSEY 48 V2 TaxID=2939561 RepID=UPI002041336E|nr:O-antigen polymerase [Curtobacterium sp. ODYSSEY 48 V2]MCM3505968.1 oligosaccharide repeat unit polymerase [Curtobacterium sp. ODYSSEY 48 V2]
MTPFNKSPLVDRAAPAFGSILFIILGLLVPVAVVGLTPNPLFDTWPGAALIATLSAARFSWAVSGAKRRLFEMVIGLFVYGFLGVAPLVQLRTGDTPETTPGFAAQYATTTIGVVLVGYLSIIVGSWAWAIRRRNLSDAPLPARSTRLAPVRVYGVTVFAFVMTSYYLYKMGLQSIVSPRAALDSARAAAWSDSTTATLVGGFTTMSLLVASIAQILLWRQLRRDGEVPNIPLAVFTGIALLAVVNPVNSARYAVGTVYLALLAACAIYWSLRRYRTVATGALAALFFIFPIASTFRRTLDTSIQFRSPLQSLTGGDFDSFSQINNAVFYVAANGTTLGKQFLGVFFFWVPRSIWPDKAVDTGALLANFRNYTFTNLSAPLWAEFFVNGGWVAVIVGMLGVGYLARLWDERLNNQIRMVSAPGIIGCILPFYSLILLRGSLLQAVASLAVVILLAAFLAPTRQHSVTVPPEGAFEPRRSKRPNPKTVLRNSRAAQVECSDSASSERPEAAEARD